MSRPIVEGGIDTIKELPKVPFTVNNSKYLEDSS
jgi:hypothetical protein